MEGRNHLTLKHWLDSLLVSFVAASVAGMLRYYITERFAFLVDSLAGNAYLIPAIAGLTPLLLATIWPVRMSASLKSIRLFPRHVGIFPMAMIGFLIFVVGDLAIIGKDSYSQLDILISLLAIVSFVIGRRLLSHQVRPHESAHFTNENTRRAANNTTNHLLSCRNIPSRTKR